MSIPISIFCSAVNKHVTNIFSSFYISVCSQFHKRKVTYFSFISSLHLGSECEKNNKWSRTDTHHMNWSLNILDPYHPRLTLVANENAVNVHVINFPVTVNGKSSFVKLYKSHFKAGLNRNLTFFCDLISKCVQPLSQFYKVYSNKNTNTHKLSACN